MDEVTRLRQALVESANALPRCYAHPDCSTAFLVGLPEEIRLVVKRYESTIHELEQAVAAESRRANHLATLREAVSEELAYLDQLGDCQTGATNRVRRALRAAISAATGEPFRPDAR